MSKTPFCGVSTLMQYLRWTLSIVSENLGANESAAKAAALAWFKVSKPGDARTHSVGSV